MRAPNSYPEPRIGRGGGTPWRLGRLVAMSQEPDRSTPPARPTRGSRASVAGSPHELGDPSLIGRTVSGKYKIESFLGGGAMGAVYKAHFKALEKNVAVKVMHRAIAVDPSFVGRFHREAKAASRLDHPNSMRVIDFGEEPDGLLYIAMEYVEGRDLYRVIHEDWPLANDDIADILMQALAALAVAHEMGVIHRDLKPENLMILRAKNDEDQDAYVVKVCDFGIAKLTENDDDPNASRDRDGQRLTTQGLVVGTPEYMSPEQARGEKLDTRSDIYAMGIILYQLLTGRTPFTADTALAVVLKHITEAPAAPSVHYACVHKGLEAVAMRAIAKDRNDRFQTARAMRNTIRDAIAASARHASAAPAEVTSTRMRSAAALAGGSRVLPVESAPTVASGLSTSSHITPVATAALVTTALSSASTSRRRARPRYVRAALSLAVMGGLVSGVVLGVPRLRELARGLKVRGFETDTPLHVGLPPGASVSSFAASPPPSSLAPAVPNLDPLQPVSAVPPSESKTSKRGPLTVAGRSLPTVTAGVDSASATAPAAETSGASLPLSPDASSAVPTAAAGEVPSASTFNSASCRAQVGAPRASGTASAKDVTLNGTAGAWTSCAQRFLHEMPSTPIVANVHLLFGERGAFRHATCADCPSALAQCVATSTGRTVALKTRNREAMADPAFDIAVTFACE